MATRFVERQVEAFEDPLMREHHEADLCRDVDDAVSIAVCLAKLLVNSTIRHYSQPGWSDEVAEGRVQLCELLLRKMSGWRRLVVEMEKLNYEVAGADDFRARMLELRELMAWLRDPTSATVFPSAAEYEAAVRCGDGQQPPQEWFDEDTRDLRGLNHHGD